MTLLFSDIEGSTRLLERLGDRYGEVLGAHRDLLRGCFDAHDGCEVDTEGDAFFVAFASPREAVAAAADGQRALSAHRWPEGAALRVRMGLHVGEPRLADDHYVGMDVHRAARICSAAHGGQVVVSARLREMLEDRALDGVAFRALGAHRLKDLDEPEELHQLDIDGLPATFPPLRSLRPPTNVPRHASPLIGRHVEREELCELLGLPDVRLVTVTGPGGVGKTRLVSAVALDVLDRFSHGVYFVDLSDVTAGSAILPAVAQALRVPLDGGVPAGEAVAAYVADRRMLVVLDNAEQIHDGALSVAGLLQDCPRVSVTVTSRRLLGLRDEYEYSLSPLGLPAGSSLALVAGSEAAQLFVDRARRSRRGFELKEENAASVARICTLLDGLPLAVELAAARARLFSAQALAARLTDRLELLTTGAHDVPGRHRTLRATVDWSYELLTEEERRFFQDMSVFAGGARADTVEEVTGHADALELVSTLVEHSLVTQEEDADGEPRFTMLRTLRDYASDLLRREPAREAELRERHARHFRFLVEQALPPERSPTRQSLELVEQDHDNVHAALAYWLGQSDNDPDAGAQALGLAVAMAQYWHRHGQAQDGTAWLERALAAAPDPSAATRATALRMLGRMHEQLRAHERAAALLTEAAALYRQVGDRAGEADCLTGLGMVARTLGEYAEAESLLERAEAIRRDIGDGPGLAATLNSLALLRLDQDGRPAGAAEHDARPAVEAMVRFLAVADVDGVVETLEVCIGLALARDRWIAAARLAGAARAARRRLELPTDPPGRGPLDTRVEQIRRHLGDQAFHTALREGEALSLEEATGYILAEVLDS